MTTSKGSIAGLKKTGKGKKDTAGGDESHAVRAREKSKTTGAVAPAKKAAKRATAEKRLVEPMPPLTDKAEEGGRRGACGRPAAKGGGATKAKSGVGKKCDKTKDRESGQPASAAVAHRGKKTAHADSLLARYQIVHDIPGRIRLRPLAGVRPSVRAKDFAALFENFAGADFEVSDKTGSVLILYQEAALGREVRARVQKPAAAMFPAGRPPVRKALKAIAAAKEVCAPPPVRTTVRNPVPGKIRSFFIQDCWSMAWRHFALFPIFFPASKPCCAVGSI